MRHGQKARVAFKAWPSTGEITDLNTNDFALRSWALPSGTALRRLLGQDFLLTINEGRAIL